MSSSRWDELAALEPMLLSSGTGGKADIDSAAEGAEGLGLFIRSLVGLDREPATEAFARYLDDTRFTVDQVRIVGVIADILHEVRDHARPGGEA